MMSRLEGHCSSSRTLRIPGMLSSLVRSIFIAACAGNKNDATIPNCCLFGGPELAEAEMAHLALLLRD